MVIPAQDVSDGVLTIRVIEGRVGRISTEGVGYFSYERNYAPYLPKKGEALNVDGLRENLRRLNAHPDKDASVALRRGTEPGSTDLHLSAREDHPFHFSVGLDNSGAGGPLRLRSTMTLQYDNFLDRSQAGTFQYYVCPEDRDFVRQYVGSYRVPLAPLGGPAGHAVSAYGAYSDTESSAAGGLLDLFGEGWILGGRYEFPLPGSAHFEHSLALGAEWQRIENQVQFGGLAVDTEVEKLPFTLLWSGVHSAAGGRTRFSLGLRYQVDSVPSNFSEEDYRAVRAGADTDFWAARLLLSRSQQLTRGWVGIISMQGQLAGDRLLPSEQFGLGGHATVRGYRYRAITADQALTTRAELRTPPLDGGPLAELNGRVQFLGFADAGWGWARDATVGDIDNENLASVGLGLRAALLGDSLVARLDFGSALNDLEATGRDEQGDLVSHFGIVYRY